MLLAVVLIGIGYGANIALEEHKKQQVQQQFFLERKLEAVNAIKDAYQKAFEAFYFTTVSDKDKAKPLLFAGDPEKEFYKALQLFSHVSDRYDIIMSRYFADLVQVNGTLLEGIYYKDRTKRIEYRDFLWHLRDCFVNQCRIELGLLVEMRQNQFFPFQKFKFEEIQTQGAVYFLDINFKKWKLWSKNNK